MKFDKGDLPMNMMFLLAMEFFAKGVNATQARNIVCTLGYNIEKKTLEKFYQRLRHAIICCNKDDI